MMMMINVVLVLLAAPACILGQSAPCGGNLTSLTGEILSPGYPGEYNHLADCVWTVDAPLNHQITLTFNHFKLEDNCRDDSLTIWNGPSEVMSPFVGKFCGRTLPPVNITLDTNQARLRFASDETVALDGFNITYDASPIGCGRSESSTNGTFAAPYYSADVTQESQLPCVWQFETNPGNHLELSFLYIDSTYVTVRTGNADSEMVDLPVSFSPAYNMTDYTSRGGFYTVPIHNNSVWIEYAPGDHPALRNTWHPNAFFATYKTVCDVTINDMYGVIESPGFPRGYQNHLNCSWTLDAPAGFRYFLQLETVDLEVHDECEYDNVTVFDGTEPVIIGCLSEHEQDVVLNNSNGLIQFATDISNSKGGFRIIYNAVPQSPPTTTTTPEPIIPCGRWIKTVHRGTITSPGYPNPYKHSAECIWEISPPSPVHQIVLNVNYFDLEEGPWMEDYFGQYVYDPCRNDYLEFRDGNTPTSMLLGKYCGRDIPSTIVTNGPAVWIKFYSDETGSRNGFNISFEAIANSTRLPPSKEPCGGKFTSLTGEILSPGYPDQYKHLADCVWTVDAPLNHQITLTFNHFELQQSCDMDWLMITNGMDWASPLVGRFCGDNPPPVNITLDTHQALLHFVSDDDVAFGGINITYDATPIGCGRRENSTNGTFAAPGYPEDIAMESSLPCVWQFQTNPGNQLELAFSYIDSTYMKVRTGNAEGELVDLPVAFSPAYNNTDYIARGGFYTVPIHNNSVWVEYAPADHPNALLNMWRHTFFATYKTVCSVTIKIEKWGLIDSPGFPRGYAAYMNCIWTLEAPVGHRIYIQLHTVDLDDNDNGCEHDSVTVFDGTDPETRRLVTVACHILHQQDYKLSSRTALIQFQSNYGYSRRGFRILYHAFPESEIGYVNTKQTTATVTGEVLNTDQTTAPSTGEMLNTDQTGEMLNTDQTTATVTDEVVNTNQTNANLTDDVNVNESARGHSDTQNAAIAGGVIGGLVLIAFISMAIVQTVWWYTKRRSTSTNSDYPFTHFANGTDPTVAICDMMNENGHYKTDGD